MFDVDSYSFAGPIIYDGEKSEKLKRDDLLDDGTYDFYSTAGWFGSIQHHFVTAVVPPRGEDHKYEVSVHRRRVHRSTIGETCETIAPGAARRFRQPCS